MRLPTGDRARVIARAAVDFFQLNQIVKGAFMQRTLFLIIELLLLTISLACGQKKYSAAVA